jgi:hypothetical protein
MKAVANQVQLSGTSRSKFNLNANVLQAPRQAPSTDQHLMDTRPLSKDETLSNRLLSCQLTYDTYHLPIQVLELVSRPTDDSQDSFVLDPSKIWVRAGLRTSTNQQAPIFLIRSYSRFSTSPDITITGKSVSGTSGREKKGHRLKELIFSRTLEQAPYMEHRCR